MSPKTLGEVGSNAIAVLAGLYFVLLSSRRVGKPPGLDSRYDAWHARWKGLFRYGGLFLTAFGLLFIAVTLVQEYQSAGPPAESDWRTVLAADGKASAEMPGEPAREDKEMASEGGAVSMHTLRAQASGGRCSFRLTYSDVPEASRGLPEADVLDQSRAGLLASVSKATVLGEAEFVDAGWPGLHLELVAAGQRYSVKMSVARGKVYRAVCVTPDDDRYTAASQRFINSFKLLTKKE